MMIKRLSGALAFALLMNNAYADDQEHYVDIPAPLPHTFGSVMQSSMESPLAIFYAAEVAYKDKDYSTALRWYLDGAKKLHVPSVENAKYMIQANEGVADNRSDVIEFLTYYGTPTGLESGDLFAQLYLADYFSGHSCVWVDYSESDRSLSEHCLGLDTKKAPVSEKDYTKAYYWYSSAAEQGSTRAKYSLSMMDILGLAGARNIKKGMSLLEEVAQDGYASANYILGEMHNQGFWIAQDAAEANKYFSLAAESNLPKAQLALADNYVKRRGIDVDSSVASADAAYMLYERVLKNLLASPTQEAQAHLAIANIARFQRGKLSPDDSFKHFQDAIAIAAHEPNVSSVEAASSLGDMAVEADDMDTALKYYTMAEEMLPSLGHAERKQYASILQRIANIHARGTQTLPKNERLYANYMQNFHSMRASETMAPTQPLSLFGEHAFEFSY